MSDRATPNYTSLAQKEVTTIVRKYRYHPQVKKSAQNALSVMSLDPQKAYKHVISFANELKSLIAQEEPEDRVNMKHDYIGQIFQYLNYTQLGQFLHLEDEFNEIIRTYGDVSFEETSQQWLEAELDEFYHNRFLPTYKQKVVEMSN